MALTRDPAKLADLAARGVEVRKGDFDDPATLPAAFAGVDRALIVSTDSRRHAPGATQAAHGRGCRGGRRRGEAHRLHVGPVAASRSRFRHCRRSLLDRAGDRRESGRLDVPAQQSLRRGRFDGARRRGRQRQADDGDPWRRAQLRHPRGLRPRRRPRRWPTASRAQRILDVTGPAAVTQAELAAMASAVTGRPIEVGRHETRRRCARRMVAVRHAASRLPPYGRLRPRGGDGLLRHRDAGRSRS